MRTIRLQDRLLAAISRGLGDILDHAAPSTQASRPGPAAAITEPELSTEEKKHSAGLMRVNHSGEVCAQALYLGQSVAAQDASLHDTLKQAALEEEDHLAWTAERLEELESHTSYLNAVWYSGSFMLGLLAGIAGDKWSLGFIVETENQVVAHLGNHLDQLPEQDTKSRAIVAQMRTDEGQHATTAIEAGATRLPGPIPVLMRCTARIMTRTAYWI